MTRPSLRSLASTVVLCLALAAPALATRPIDDFELGPFSVQSTGDYQVHQIHVDQHQAHLYTPVREVVLEPAGPADQVSVQLQQNAGDDAVEVTVDAGGRARFQYLWDVPFDVTENGAYDRIQLAYESVTPGAFFSFALVNAGTVCGVERFPDPGPGTVSWPIDICGAIDPTQAIGFILYCYAGSEDASFEITDVRLMRSNAMIVADIERQFVAIQVPPIPSPPLGWRSFDPLLQPLFDTAVVLESVVDEGYVPEMSADLQEEAFQGGEIVRSTVLWDDALPPGNVQMVLSVELTAAGGWTPTIAYPPDPVRGPADVTILTGAMLTDGDGTTRGSSMIALEIAPDPAQNVNIGDVQVEVTDGVLLDQNRLEIALWIDGDGFQPGLPFLHLRWLADWQAEVLTGVASPPRRDGGALALLAAPSVTSAATELRASRPFLAGATVRIHDLAGRLVCELRPAAGSRAVRWDGRDASGAAAASGIYLARWRTPDGDQAATKVVRVR